jgi:hypothetical protein
MSYATSSIPDPETVISILREESTNIDRGGGVMGATDVGKQLGEKRLDSYRKTRIRVGGEGNVEKIQYDRNFVTLNIEDWIFSQSLCFFCASHLCIEPFLDVRNINDMS